MLISHYTTTGTPSVQVANVGSSTISVNACSVVSFDVFSELSNASAELVGALPPGATTVMLPGASAGPGSIGIFNAPPVPNGTPFSTDNEITGMVYLDNDTVFGISHLTEPDHNDIYACIYGGSGQGPFRGPFPKNPNCF